MEKSFTPSAILHSLFQFWWWIVLCMVFGGVIGWGIHQLMPPVYEAQAVITSTIDFTRTGELTDIQEDQAAVLIGDVITSSTVVDQVISATAQKGISISLEDFRIASSLERQQDRWLLIYRSENRAQAVEMANTWAQKAMLALEEAHQHAVIADQLVRYLDGLSGCLEQTVMVEPVYALCQYNSVEELQAELKKTGDLLAQEKLASFGLMPASSFAWLQEADLPLQPALYARTSLIFWGAVIGLIGAIWTNYLGIPGRLFNRVVKV